MKLQDRTILNNWNCWVLETGIKTIFKKLTETKGPMGSTSGQTYLVGVLEEKEEKKKQKEEKRKRQRDYLKKKWPKCIWWMTCIQTSNKLDKLQVGWIKRRTLRHIIIKLSNDKDKSWK